MAVNEWVPGSCSQRPRKQGGTRARKVGHSASGPVGAAQPSQGPASTGLLLGPLLLHPGPGLDSWLYCHSSSSEQRMEGEIGDCQGLTDQKGLWMSQRPEWQGHPHSSCSPQAARGFQGLLPSHVSGRYININPMSLAYSFWPRVHFTLSQRPSGNVTCYTKHSTLSHLAMGVFLPLEFQIISSALF